MQTWLLIALSTISAEAASLQRFSEIQEHMATRFELVVYCENEEDAKVAFHLGFERIAQLNGVMSDYDAKSELSRLSKTSPTSKPVHISKDLFTVLTAADSLSHRSDGAFDVTVGPLTKLWRRARRRHEYPAKDLLAKAQRSTGYRHLQLSPNDHTVNLAVPGMRLDLGGIAKGYAADEALRSIQSVGITRALVNGGGDIVAGDPPPGETGWRVAVASRDRDAEPTEFLRIANQAVATSGDVWQHVEINGKRYSHILDPKTGIGLTTRSSVTVIAKTGMQADSLASAVSVLGEVRGIELIASTPDTETLILVQSDSGVSEHKSIGFNKFVEAE